MKTARVLPLAALLLLSACFPQRREVTLDEVPAGPLVQMLEQRRQALSGFKALAGIEAARSGRKRAYDTVGIIIDGQRRLRVEAIGPLGQSLMTLVWDGADIALRFDDGRVARPGAAGLEKVLGVAMDAGEFCAVLSGNIPPIDQAYETKAFREPDGGLLLELTQGDRLRRVRVRLPGPEAGEGISIRMIELFRSGKLVYRAEFGDTERISQYIVPKTVRIENPDRRVSLSVEYSETEVNVPLRDDAFILPAGEQ